MHALLFALLIDYNIVTLAGNGVEGFAGDGGGAACASLNRPTGVDVDRQGFVYIADFSNNRIRRVAPDGTIITVAGTGERGFDGDGGPAIKAKLAGAYGVRVDGDGFLIADSMNNRVRRVDREGIIRTVASGFEYPVDVMRGPDSLIYVAEGSGNRVRRIEKDGSITPFAGSGKRRYTGEGGYSGDGGPAIDAQLNVAAALAFDRDGNLFIGDLRNHVVRRVDRNGIITTVAGTGVAGDAGDGGPALSAQLREPGGLAFEPDGSLLIAEIPRIRRLSKDGTITTIAGNTKRGFDGDYGPAASAQLSVLDLIAIDGSGNVFVADHRNSRIRKLTPVPSETATAARKSASADVETLLQRMRAAYQAIGSAEMRFRMQSPGRAITGSLMYRNPSEVNAILKVPNYGDVLITTDGHIVRVEDPTQPKPQETEWSLQNVRRAIAANLEVISLWDSQRQLNTGEGANMRAEDLAMGAREKWNGKDWLVLEEKAGQDVYRYYIDPATALMWRTKFIKMDGTIPYDGIIETLRITSRDNPRDAKRKD